MDESWLCMSSNVGQEIGPGMGKSVGDLEDLFLNIFGMYDRFSVVKYRNQIVVNVKVRHRLSAVTLALPH